MPMPEDPSLPSLVLGGKRDELFAGSSYPRPFEFNEEVAQVFDDMISRSIPYYPEVIKLLCQWLREYPLAAGQRIYDIGCSTGTTLFALGSSLKTPATLVGIDTSAPMLEQAREKLSPLASFHTVELLCTNALTSTYEQAHMVVLNYTLQFIPLTQRLALLKKIYKGLATGGIVFISEKLLANSPSIHRTFTHHYEAFKLSMGYSRSEIERKKEALDQVLVPLTMAEHLCLLHEAGFSEIDCIFKWQNFATLVAIKS
jgi:tRNA (cmo5U34)-methyltransferase